MNHSWKRSKVEVDRGGGFRPNDLGSNPAWSWTVFLHHHLPSGFNGNTDDTFPAARALRCPRYSYAELLGAE